MEPKVTIVTAVYNGEKYLEETIKSITNQTYSNIEYIIIDGNSTDSTVEIIKKYEDKIAYWVSEKDNGMYDAINKGFQKATGDIFAYLNADDLYCDKFVIENVVKMFEKNDVDLVFGNVEFIDANSKHLYFYKSIELPRIMIKYLKRVPFAQQTAFWKRNVYNEINGFDDSLKYVADSKFFFSIIFNKKYHYRKINKYIAKFRWHDEGFSTADKEKMNKESELMKKELKVFSDVNLLRYCTEAIIKIYNLQNVIKKFNLDTK